MNTVIVWLLISISTGYGNSGNVHVVERFATEGDCNWVIQNLKSVSLRGEMEQSSKCIKARVLEKK